MVASALDRLGAATASDYLPISGLTAWQGLFVHGQVQTGQSVLVHGAAGGVGSMVTQLADVGGVDLVFDVIGGDTGEQSAVSAARW